MEPPPKVVLSTARLVIDLANDVSSLPESTRTVESIALPESHPPLAEASCVFIYPKSSLLGRRYLLGDDTVIGRGTDCQITNPDASVSRHHARIRPAADGKFYVTDLQSTNGTYINHVRVLDHPLADGDYLRVGNCIYRFLTGGNVEAMYHEEIYRLTVMDPLTGAFNRRYLREYLTRELARAARYHRPVAVVMFDLDHFKAVNDQYGHLVGDLTLKHLTEQVGAMVRKDELLCRFGGEEFVVVLPEADAEGARTFAERARQIIEQTLFTHHNLTVRLTVSVGLAVADHRDGLTPDALLQRADAALYMAKRNGRNRVCG